MSVANLKFVFEWLEVNIAGSVLHSLIEHQIDEANDRHFIGQVGHFCHVIRRCRFRSFLGQLRVRAQLSQDVSDTFIVFPVIFADELFDGRRIGHQHLNFLAHAEAQFINHGRIERLRQRHLYHRIIDRHRNALVHSRHRRRHRFDHFGGKVHVMQRDHFGAEMFGLDLQLRIDINELKIRKDLADRLAAAVLFLQHLLQLQVVD